MPFDINQLPSSADQKNSEVEETAARLRRFKLWFVGIVLVCLGVITGAAIFYSIVGY